MTSLEHRRQKGGSELTRDEVEEAFPHVERLTSGIGDRLDALMARVLDGPEAFGPACRSYDQIMEADLSLGEARRKMHRLGWEGTEAVKFIDHFQEARRHFEPLLGPGIFARLAAPEREAVLAAGWDFVAVSDHWPPLAGAEIEALRQRLEARADHLSRLNPAGVLDTVSQALQAALQDAEGRCREADWHNNNTPFVGSRVPYQSGPAGLARQLRDACQLLADPEVRLVLGIGHVVPSPEEPGQSPDPGGVTASPEAGHTTGTTSKRSAGDRSDRGPER